MAAILVSRVKNRAVEARLRQFWSQKISPSGPKNVGRPVATVLRVRKAQVRERDMSTLESNRLNLLEELFAAFNRHDGEAVMTCVTDDIVFDAAAGPDICGRRFLGASDVRAAFEGTWTTMPDVSWQCIRHEIFGDRGISEWIFRATASDGRVIEAEGCDLFVFRGDKISSKSAFRKDRPLQPTLVTAEAAR